jgi:flagellin
MARINTNISSVIAQANLARNQSELNLRMERLSTGLRINRGADDPAGLIISERIRSDITGVEQGIKNSDRASSMISTTEASLAEVNDLLNSIRALIVESANTGATSDEERLANQLQIDSAIDSITRISNTASFGGLRLLDGTLDYRLSGVVTSAVAIAQIRNASLINNAALQVEVDVIGSAQVGSLYYNAGTTPAGVILSSMTLEVKGPKGVQELRFLSGTTMASVIKAVNDIKEFTGVEASLINADPTSGIVFQTTEYGADALVSVRRVDPPSDSNANSWRTYRFDDAAQISTIPTMTWSALVEAQQDVGRDVAAVVNGYLATGKGLDIIVNSPSLGLKLTLTEEAGVRPGATTSSFYITGGGSLFQLGPEVSALQQVNFGIPSVAASRLGGSQTSSGIEFLSSLKTGGRNSIAEAVRRNDFTDAQEVLTSSIDEVTELRGRLGAFERNVLDTNVRSLQSQFENLTASESRIRDADFAFETSQLTRAQILVSAGTSTLQLANTQSQQVLQLLGG